MNANRTIPDTPYPRPLAPPRPKPRTAEEILTDSYRYYWEARILVTEARGMVLRAERLRWFGVLFLVAGAAMIGYAVARTL